MRAKGIIASPMSTAAWTARTAQLVGLVLVALQHPAAARAPDRRDALAAELRGLYGPPQGPEERWWRRSTVTLADGREVPRASAFRDDPAFVAAALRLLASRSGDDAPLGAWLLGTLPVARRREAEAALTHALAHPDARAAFEAAQALGSIGGRASRAALLRAARESTAADVRTAASWAAAEIARREGRGGSGLEMREREGSGLVAPG